MQRGILHCPVASFVASPPLLLLFSSLPHRPIMRLRARMSMWTATAAAASMLLLAGSGGGSLLRSVRADVADIAEDLEYGQPKHAHGSEEQTPRNTGRALRCPATPRPNSGGRSAKLRNSLPSSSPAHLFRRCSPAVSIAVVADFLSSVVCGVCDSSCCVVCLQRPLRFLA